MTVSALAEVPAHLHGKRLIVQLRPAAAPLFFSAHFNDALVDDLRSLLSDLSEGSPEVHTTKASSPRNPASVPDASEIFFDASAEGVRVRTTSPEMSSDWFRLEGLVYVDEHEAYFPPSSETPGRAVEPEVPELLSKLIAGRVLRIETAGGAFALVLDNYSSVLQMHGVAAAIAADPAAPLKTEIKHACFATADGSALLYGVQWHASSAGVRLVVPGPDGDDLLADSGWLTQETLQSACLYETLPQTFIVAAGIESVLRFRNPLCMVPHLRSEFDTFARQQPLAPADVAVYALLGEARHLLGGCTPDAAVAASVNRLLLTPVDWAPPVAAAPVEDTEQEIVFAADEFVESVVETVLHDYVALIARPPVL